MSDTKNLTHQEAIEKMREIASETNISMFCTSLSQQPFNTCPMATQEVDDHGKFWFFSKRTSDHNKDIRKDSRVQLLYANNSNYSYLSVYGDAKEVHDRARMKELWSPEIKIWFPEGLDDPDLTLICVTPDEGYYWDTKSSKMVSFLKMAASLVTGNKNDDGIQGHIDV